MTDTTTQHRRRIHLAYAAASSGLPAPLVQALEAAGFEVSHAPSTHTADDAALASAHLVLVCWTPAAVASDAVTLHAARARKAGKLASVLLAPCAPPSSLGRHYLLADLSGWRGDATDREFVQLVHAIHARQSRRLFSSAPQWAARYMSWGGLGAVALGTVAIVANFGDVRQTIDGVFNPSASEAALSATDAKVEEVLTLLKQKSSEPLSADAEATLRQSIERLLTEQSGARGEAARLLAKGDIEGALDKLRGAAFEGERAAVGLADTYADIGALQLGNDTFDAMDAFSRAGELVPDELGYREMVGYLQLRAGLLDDAHKTFDTLLLEAEYESEMATPYGNLGIIAKLRGDYAAARENFQKALAINRKAASRFGEAADISDLGEIARLERRLREAETYLTQSLAIFKEIDHPEGVVAVNCRLGAVARDRAQFDKAHGFYSTALSLADAAGYTEGISFAQAGLGDIALARGDLDTAKAAYAASDDAARKIDAGAAQAAALTGLGKVAQRERDSKTAIMYFRNAVMLYRDMGMTKDIAELTTRLKALGATSNPEDTEN